MYHGLGGASPGRGRFVDSTSELFSFYGKMAAGGIGIGCHAAQQLYPRPAAIGRTDPVAISTALSVPVPACVKVIIVPSGDQAGGNNASLGPTTFLTFDPLASIT